MNKQGYMPKSKSQTHLTPDRIYDMIEDTWGLEKQNLYDPCPAYTPYKAPIFFNGLYGDWQDFNYVNCPYEVKTLTLFVEKAFHQANKGKTTIMLNPTKTDQDWFHDYIVPLMNRKPQDVLWIRKRLKFKNNKDASMGGHFLVLIQCENCDVRTDNGRLCRKCKKNTC